MEDCVCVCQANHPSIIEARLVLGNEHFLFWQNADSSCWWFATPNFFAHKTPENTTANPEQIWTGSLGSNWSGRFLETQKTTNSQWKRLKLPKHLEKTHKFQKLPCFLRVWISRYMTHVLIICLAFHLWRYLTHIYIYSDSLAEKFNKIQFRDQKEIPELYYILINMMMMIIIIIIPITLKIIIIVLMIFCLGARSTGSPAFSEPQWWTVSPPPGLWQVWWPPIQVSLLHSGGAAEFDGLWRILCTGFAFVFFPDQRFLDPSTDVEIETDVTFLFCHAGAMIIAFREVMIQLRSLKSLGGETQMGWEKTFKNMIKHGKLGKIMEDNEKIWQHDKGHKNMTIWEFDSLRELWLKLLSQCAWMVSSTSLQCQGLRFVQSLWADPSHVILKGESGQQWSPVSCRSKHLQMNELEMAGSHRGQGRAGSRPSNIFK